MRKGYMAATGLLALIGVGCGQSTAPPSPAPAASPTPPAQPSSAEPVGEATGERLVEDDGRTLWASPTSGDPLDISAVPDGASLIVHFRPADLLATEEGQRVWRALGPWGASAGAAVEQAGRAPLASTQEVLIGVKAGASYGEVGSTVVVDPQPTDRLPLLQREIEQLLETTDRDRLLTLVFSPRFVLGDGGSMLAGSWAPLRELCLAQLRDEWAAASISLHLDDAQRLFWELRVITSVDIPESRAAGMLTKQAGAWPATVQSVVADRGWSAYSAEIVRRSPAMWRVVSQYARRGVDRRQAVLSGYTPAGSAHQLVLASERIIAELASPTAGPTVTHSKTPELSIHQRLRRPVTIAFRRESLETAVAILSEALGASIVIEGRDLQLEGITRNQMLGLDVADKTAAEALVDILRRANPDPLAEGPSDPRQRLVYTVNGDQLTITTRAAAQRRGDELPDVFKPR